ncbi:MAG TPA: glycoside hydrolase family 3 N-terminal domain-containing protein [Thermoleophilaceae bacterium]|jgi:beta-glucosidase|nr:glycoside hydrolase family 3 N-terminal domain-containing protein [Thermoleophilaceae bacterium]
MFRKTKFRASIVFATLAVLAAVAGGVVIAATQSSDEEALAPSRPPADPAIETKVNNLVSQMSLQEKLQQLTLTPDFLVKDDDVRAGLGAVLSQTDPDEIRRLQKIAVEDSPHHIPLLFAFDTIHGFRTIFPIPLGSAASFDPQMAKNDAFFGARESFADGLKQTYAPMVDVSHEPRWGRISEGGGEDPYLGSVMAAARVKGFQGTNYGAENKVAASPKHFAAYGQPEGGRDYNTTDMSEQRLRNLYLPPFKAAIDAGADTAMCSFNAINGVPGCGNHYTMTDILKGQWGFDGFVEADWAAVDEMRSCPPKNPDSGDCGHGVAGDGPSAAALALNAGLDSEMTSTEIRTFGAQLVQSGAVSMKRIDDAVRRILRVKFRAGLFDHPYSPYEGKPAVNAQMLQSDAVDAAKTAAERSMVLLKNEGNNLPLDPSKKTAVIGPLGDDKHDMLGPWWGRGDENPASAIHTVFEAASQEPGGAVFAQGCQLSNEEPPGEPEGCNTTDFSAATAAVGQADQVLLVVGESREMSGEAASRSTLDLPGNQEQLIHDVVAAAGSKKVAVVLMNGRPLVLSDVIGEAPAWLEAWFPGVQAGPAVADVVFGRVNPGGKLPVSFPRRLGQVPIYYNHEPTGRPCDAGSKYNSRYRDLPSCDPLFPFGYGLSYSTFNTTGLTLSRSTVSKNGSLTATVTIENPSDTSGDDVFQLYIHDPVASISQPVRRLRGFERMNIPAHSSKSVTFTLDKSDFGFYDNRGKFVVEPGVIDVYAGDSSAATMTKSFTVSG